MPTYFSLSWINSENPTKQWVCESECAKIVHVTALQELLPAPWEGRQTLHPGKNTSGCSQSLQNTLNMAWASAVTALSPCSISGGFVLLLAFKGKKSGRQGHTQWMKPLHYMFSQQLPCRKFHKQEFCTPQPAPTSHYICTYFLFS